MPTNELVDEAKRALSEGRKVVIATYPPGVGPTIAIARERDEAARQANTEGCRLLIYGADGENQSESGVDRAAARELLNLGAEFKGLDHLRP